MRIPCPFCGDRDAAEFVCRGEAVTARPDPAAPGAGIAAFDDLYLRDNPAGPTLEHWQHVHGCRLWLVVARDTRTHAVTSATPAAEMGR